MLAGPSEILILADENSSKYQVLEGTQGRSLAALRDQQLERHVTRSHGDRAGQTLLGHLGRQHPLLPL